MQPYRRHKRSAPLSTLIGSGILLIAAIVILFLIIRAMVTAIPIPAINASDMSKGFSSRRAMLARIDELEAAVESFRIAQDETVVLKKENESLKAELGRSANPEGVLARVLTTPERNLYDTILIDAGSDDGVALGHIAYAFDSVALGTIAEVYERRATVELFSAAERETAGTAEGSDVSITLIGRGGGEFEVRMPRDVAFTVGELISLQSVHLAVLAKIEKVVTDPRDPFQRLLAKAPVNLTALKYVVVK